MRIVLVEDDFTQADLIHARLQEAFRRADIVRVRTEREFRTRIKEFVKQPPDVFLIDVMLRWSDPAPDWDSVPEEVEQQGFYRAGIRCARLVRENERIKNVPVIFYTVLEHNDLADDITSLTGKLSHLRKESDARPLIQQIRAVTQKSRQG